MLRLTAVVDCTGIIWHVIWCFPQIFHVNGGGMLGLDAAFGVEPIGLVMVFGFGFLFASVIALPTIAAVHGRAERLTIRRLNAATPTSMAEIQADKDRLRAEFAMSTRRLEMSIEELKNKTSSHASELEKKSDVIKRLKVAFDEKSSTILALESRGKTLEDREKMLFNHLQATKDDLSIRTDALLDANRALVEAKSEIADLKLEEDRRSDLLDSQSAAIVVLTTQIDAAIKLASLREKSKRQETSLPENGSTPKRLRSLLNYHLGWW